MHSMSYCPSFLVQTCPQRLCRLYQPKIWHRSGETHWRPGTLWSVVSKKKIFTCLLKTVWCPTSTSHTAEADQGKDWALNYFFWYFPPSFMGLRKLWRCQNKNIEVLLLNETIAHLNSVSGLLTMPVQVPWGHLQQGQHGEIYPILIALPSDTSISWIWKTETEMAIHYRHVFCSCFLLV